MTKNEHKIFGAFMSIIIITQACIIAHLSDYKKNCINKYKMEPTLIETQLLDARNQIELLNNQLANNELALKQAHNQIMSFKSKCKDCQYHITQNWGE